MKRLANLFLAALLAFAPIAQADLRATASGTLGLQNANAVVITGGTGVPIKKLSGGLPLVKPPSGTMGNNGAFTSGTAFARTIAKSYMWFATNQISGANAQGWFYTECSSTTVCIVYQNTYTTGVAQQPTSKTAWVATGPGATTGVTTLITAQQVTITGGTLGADGSLAVEMIVTANNSAGAKVFTINFGGTNFHSASLTTNLQAAATARIANQDDVAVQGGYATGVAVVGSSLSYVSGAVNTAADATLSWTITTGGAATDWGIVEVATAYLGA